MMGEAGIASMDQSGAIAASWRVQSLHAVRHSAVTNVYRKTRALFLAQRFARHASPLTTTVYTHPSDEEMSAQLQRLEC